MTFTPNYLNILSIEERNDSKQTGEKIVIATLKDKVIPDIGSKTVQIDRRSPGQRRATTGK